MKIKALVLVALLFSFSLTAFAQTSRGTVSGTVTDQAGAVVPGATITLTNTATTVDRTTTSNDEGFYRFDAVDLGTYTITIAAANFGTTTQTDLIVQANQTRDVSVALQAGSQAVTVDVSAEAGALLQTEAPVRGGNISPKQITELPIGTRNPVDLALTLPGVSTNRGSQGSGTFSVNGARGRSNNFLIDGTENNDISIAGQGFQITNPDAVQEVSVQTSNYDSEFGRAGGAVINAITKSGTSQFHGTLAFLYDSSADDAITSSQGRNPRVIARGRRLTATEFIPSATFGGPLFLPRFGEGGEALNRRRDRTFFFGAYQEDRNRIPGSVVTLNTLTQAGRDRLRALFPVGTNPNVDLLLNSTQNSIAPVANLPAISLDNQNLPAAQQTRGQVETGQFRRSFSDITIGKQFQLRIDHKISDSDQFSSRYLSDSNIEPLGGIQGFEGFDADFASKYKNFLVSETHVFSPTITNELRLAYNRIVFGFPLSNPGVAGDLPQINITGLSSLGADPAFPQGRIANNYQIQDTVTKVFGDHTFRGGVDFLRQISRQQAPANLRGSTTFGTGGGFTSLGNFVDNFGGSGSVSRFFGNAIFNPTLYRTAVFFQDRYKATESLTLTLGLRYERFGTPFNSLRTPAVTSLFTVNPTTLTGPFSEPNRIPADKNNFAPTVGVNYSPSFTNGLMGHLFGEKKTVFRAGYQIGYDSFFNNIASNSAASSPNGITTTVTSTLVTGTAPRGLANFSTQFPTTAAAVLPSSGQTLIAPNLVNPYYQRYSIGFQRELPGKITLDVSYVGSQGRKLFLQEDLNPLVRPDLRITPAGFTGSTTCAPGTAGCLITGRLDNLQGARTVRGNGGSSSYNSGQFELRRRFSNSFLFTAAYTRSKFISNGDEVFGNSTGTNSPGQAVPTVFVGSRPERALSNFDRPNRTSLTYVYDVPFLREQRGLVGHLLGGFEIAGVTTFESGTPFTVFNIFDADGIGGGLDRPNFNPNGQRGVRAVPQVDTNNFITGYINPEVIIGRTSSGSPIFQPIDPNTAQFIINPAFVIGAAGSVPRTGTLGRNTQRSPGFRNTNLTLLKRTRLSGESRSIEARAELFNAFNHPNFGIGAGGTGSINSSANTLTQGFFLNPDTVNTGGGARTIRYQVKLIF